MMQKLWLLRKISYPRSEVETFPNDFQFRPVVEKIMVGNRYHPTPTATAALTMVSNTLIRPPDPTPANQHPSFTPIVPTNSEWKGTSSDADEFRLWQVVAAWFMGSIHAEDFVYVKSVARFSVGDYIGEITTIEVTSPGWAAGFDPKLWPITPSKEKFRMTTTDSVEVAVDSAQVVRPRPERVSLAGLTLRLTEKTGLKSLDWGPLELVSNGFAYPRSPATTGGRACLGSTSMGRAFLGAYKAIYGPDHSWSGLVADHALRAQSMRSADAELAAETAIVGREELHALFMVFYENYPLWRDVSARSLLLNWR